jgi:hypothetical protein
MKQVAFWILLLVFCFCCKINAQSESTKVVKLEVDGKEVKKSYEVSFLINGKWHKAERTSTGFVVPTELKGEEYLAVLITFGKFQLEFSRLHISAFRTDWIVGVDKKPFSEEFVRREEMKETRRVYYIIFQSQSGLDTRLVIKEKKTE